MAKNLDSVSTELIKDEALLKLDMHISATRYLEEGILCFSKDIGDDKK